MNQDLLDGTRSLGKGAVRRVRGERGRRVEVLSGAIWITQDGDRRDIVLESGESFDFDRSGDALLSALADSRYLLLSDAEDLVRRARAVPNARREGITASGPGLRRGWAAP